VFRHLGRGHRDTPCPAPAEGKGNRRTTGFQGDMCFGVVKLWGTKMCCVRVVESGNGSIDRGKQSASQKFEPI